MTGATAARWAPEHVVALAPDIAAAAAGRTMAVPSHWAATGCDTEAVWGLCRGSGAEPYQVAVELGGRLRVPMPSTSCGRGRV